MRFLAFATELQLQEQCYVLTETKIGCVDVVKRCIAVFESDCVQECCKKSIAGEKVSK